MMICGELSRKIARVEWQVSNEIAALLLDRAAK